MYDVTAAGCPPVSSRWLLPLNFDDVLDFTEHVQPWGLDFTQVRRGRFRSSGFILSLGYLTLGYARVNQALVRRVCVPAGQYSVFTIGPDSDSSFLGAQALRVGDCISMDGESHFEAVTRGRFTDLAFSFEESAWFGSDDWLGSRASRTQGPRIENFGDAWAERLYALVDEVLKTAMAPTRGSSDASIRAALAERILVHVRSARPVEEQQSTEHRARARRRAAVQRAREFINVRLSETIRLEQVCRYACAQSRTLEYGFREMFDTPMVSYIKALRMDRVRKLLRCPSQSHRTVSELALDTGFCHLSQFASDYKKFFGESPSQTHRRAGSATGPRLLAASA
jgi:AraC family transcriptional regulator, ethanolamine operon transcriptional activator